MKTIAKAICVAVIGALCFAGGFLTSKKAHTGVNKTLVDTLVVYRTTSVSEPQFLTQQMVRWAFFTEELRDTVTRQIPVPYAVHDTVYVPIMQRYYEELDGRLRIWVSGYEPKVDRFELDERETYITTRKKWGFSVTTGPTIVLTPFQKCPIDAGWGITGGISYTF